ncbi:MAG: ChaN family lipoprotein [Leptospirillia bacterium]
MKRPSETWFRPLALAAFLCLPTAFGCATNAGPALPETVAGYAGFESPVSPYRALETLPSGTILHVPSGTEMSQTQMLDVLADSRVVYVGETHTNLEDHAVQLAVIRGLNERHPDGIMIGLEMFAHPVQKDLDRWVSGELSEHEFLKVWLNSWSEDFGYYRDILMYARAHQIPLIALNATREEIRAVSRGEAHSEADWEAAGWDGTDPYHRAYLDAIFGGHGQGGGDRFYSVQLLWDETMAASAHAALTRDDLKHRRLVVLAGGGHVQYGFGIPRRLFSRMPVSYSTVIPITVDMPDDRADLLMDVDVPEFPLPIADFVWSVDYRDLRDRKVVLGIRFDLSHTDGVWIQAVSPGSAAADAGVAAGDHLVSVDGIAMRETVDVKAALAQVALGEHGTLVVEREGVRHTLPVVYRTYTPPEEAGGARQQSMPIDHPMPQGHP